MGRDGGLILGVDRRKDPQVLHDAYNDSAGVTAAFNLNLLARLNRELGADFDLAHLPARRVLQRRGQPHRDAPRVARRRSRSRVDGLRFDFEAGETIHTECSYKYDEPRLDALVEGSGFRIEALYTDAQRLVLGGVARPRLTPYARSNGDSP